MVCNHSLASPKYPTFVNKKPEAMSIVLKSTPKLPIDPQILDRNAAGNNAKLKDYPKNVDSDAKD